MVDRYYGIIWFYDFVYRFHRIGHFFWKQIMKSIYTYKFSLFHINYCFASFAYITERSQ